MTAVGYTARLASIGTEPTDTSSPILDGEDEATRSLRQRVVVSAVLAAPVLVLSMVPLFQFRNWQWLSLTLAAPVVIWGGAPFHVAAWANLRHGTATASLPVAAANSVPTTYGQLPGYGQPAADPQAVRVRDHRSNGP